MATLRLFFPTDSAVTIEGTDEQIRDVITAIRQGFDGGRGVWLVPDGPLSFLDRVWFIPITTGLYARL